MPTLENDSLKQTQQRVNTGSGVRWCHQTSGCTSEPSYLGTAEQKSKYLMWQCKPTTLAIWRWRQEGHKFKPSLGYPERSCTKKSFSSTVMVSRTKLTSRKHGKHLSIANDSVYIQYSVYIHIYIYLNLLRLLVEYFLSSHKKIALNVVEHLEFTLIFNLYFYNLYDSMDKFPIFLCTNSKQSFFSLQLLC